MVHAIVNVPSCLSNDGNTSLVTHRLNTSVDSNLERSIRLYEPDSMIEIVLSCLFLKEGPKRTPLDSGSNSYIFLLSSESTCLRIALLGIK